MCLTFLSTTPVRKESVLITFTDNVKFGKTQQITNSGIKKNCDSNTSWNLYKGYNGTSTKRLVYHSSAYTLSFRNKLLVRLIVPHKCNSALHNDQK